MGPLSETDEGNLYILVLGDYFSKWTEAYALKNHTAHTIIDTIMEQFVSRFGVPKVCTQIRAVNLNPTSRLHFANFYTSTKPALYPSIPNPMVCWSAVTVQLFRCSQPLLVKPEMTEMTTYHM